MSLTNPPKALLTDVFGTVVDWRTTVTDYLISTAHETLSNPSSSLPSQIRFSAEQVSWADFAQQWRTSYYIFTRGYDPSTSGFKSVDQHHCESLISLLHDYGLDGLYDDTQIKKMSMIWHFLAPWPDSASGLGKLNQKFGTATLSNGNTALLSDLASHGALPYKHILSAEDFGAYKPHARVYDGAAQKLGLEPNECALVAAHLNDLEAAKGRGYQTIYIERKQEEQWEGEKVAKAKEWVDMWVSVDEGGFEEVANRFGCDGSHMKPAEDGSYHEDATIVGELGTNHKTGKGRLKSDADHGAYHEDGSITG